MESSNTFNKKYFKKLPAGLIGLLILFGGALFLFVFIMHEVLQEKEEAVDNSIFNFLLANVISTHLTGFMKAVTYFASATFLKIAYATLVLFYLLLKNWKRAIEVAAIGLGGFLVNYLLKENSNIKG